MSAGRCGQQKQCAPQASRQAKAAQRRLAAWKRGRGRGPAAGRFDRSTPPLTGHVPDVVLELHESTDLLCSARGAGKQHTVGGTAGSTHSARGRLNVNARCTCLPPLPTSFCASRHVPKACRSALLGGALPVRLAAQPPAAAAAQPAARSRRPLDTGVLSQPACCTRPPRPCPHAAAPSYSPSWQQAATLANRELQARGRGRSR